MSKSKTLRLALDAMGGDFAPRNEVMGAFDAFKEKGKNLDFEIVFIGIEDKIKSVLNSFDHSGFKYSIVHTDEVVEMDDDSTIALKKKKNSSLYKGLEMHAAGEADAFLSAGNTGAMLSTATVLLGRIPGVSRPTIGSFFPSVIKTPALLLDVGANITVKPQHLYEFGVMGSIYANYLLNIENPRVAILNIGEEKSKGTDTLLKAYELFLGSDINFIGNVEGRDILHGAADVVVCDGYTGNIVLKFAESIVKFMKLQLKNYADKAFTNKLKLLFLKNTLKDIFADFDYQNYGGVPFLGVNGVVVVGHGKSTQLAIKNMIFKATEIIEKDINIKIGNALNK